MKILSIDPGKTTGVCRADLDLKVICLCSLGMKEALILLRSFRSIDLVIVEASPQKTDNAVQREFHHRIMDWAKGSGFPYLNITPGAWKPVAKARKWAHPEALDQHQEDAYNILRYHIWEVFRKDIGVMRCLE